MTERYETCTPDITHCPDYICDDLEYLDHRICPQDCTIECNILLFSHLHSLNCIKCHVKKLLEQLKSYYQKGSFEMPLQRKCTLAKWIKAVVAYEADSELVPVTTWCSAPVDRYLFAKWSPATEDQMVEEMVTGPAIKTEANRRENGRKKQPFRMPVKVGSRIVNKIGFSCNLEGGVSSS